jgi:beta-mannanase
MKRLLQGVLILFLGLAPSARGEELKIPETGAYTGAYVSGGDTEDEVTYEKLLAFEKLAGKTQAILAFSSFWGEESFPSDQVAAVKRYGAVPLIYWSPWGPPYDQGKAQPQFDLDRIAKGRFDDYIRMWARRAARVRTPLLVAWGIEVNGNWFPWSPALFSPEETGNFTDQSRSGGPAKFIAAYRHVVDLTRSEGAHNILWVFHVNNFSFPEGNWNRMASYYPGDRYVDWLALSVYGMQFYGDSWKSFGSVMNTPYAEICKLHPTKPVMLAEWGVGEFPRRGNKAAFLAEAFGRMKKEYPRLKAAIYWHERWEQVDDLYSNLRIDSSPNSLAAYRTGMQDPFWLGRPQFRK